MYSITLTRVIRIFPLHVRLVKTMSGFYVLCFALKFDCQSFLPLEQVCDIAINWAGGLHHAKKCEVCG